VVISFSLPVETVDRSLERKKSRFGSIFTISCGSFENLCICVLKHSIVLETYCGIGGSLSRNRGTKIPKTCLKGAKQNEVLEFIINYSYDEFIVICSAFPAFIAVSFISICPHVSA
jgi:hypothetical protein